MYCVTRQSTITFYFSSDFQAPNPSKNFLLLHRILMTQHFIRCLSICALLLPTLFFSACADGQHSAELSLSNDQEVISSAPTDAEDPETELSAEVEALRRAGSWTMSNNVAQNKNLQPDTTCSDFPILINNQVQAYLDLFQNKQKKSFGIWLSRSGKYLPLMQKELKEAGLPEDLAYLAMIESGYNQKAYSKSHASGLWQFIPGTGAQYNLKMNKYLDERRDAEKSTKAAVKFLSNLYDQFGDWHLAVAAYNAGPGKISKGMERYNANDFWSLAQHDYLAMETKRYVPKLIASIIIAKNPEQYGFTDIQPEEPYSYDTLEVGPGLTLDAIAMISNCDRKTIDRLNQELSTDKTPLNQSSYPIKIPVGSQNLASKNLPRLHRVATTDYKTHTIRKGESLSQVCNRYDINKTTLLKVNNLRNKKLVSGQRLRIPYQTVRYQLLPEGTSQAIAAATQDNFILHRIQKGESISQIARKYKVPAELIVSWNNLPSSHNIRAGQQLSLYIDQKNNTFHPANAATSIASNFSQEDNVIILATQAKKTPTDDIASNGTVTINNAQSPKKSQYSWYNVQDGDTLWTIAKVFNLSPLQIKQWNNLQSNMIHPGKRLKIKDV
ncbi:MAG: LysM peptidoglycan-binding domain-containing protein [Desulfocapsa sp.]|nr:LysM peptidoglycan-binding domain-containing protein [Desulfocapsa sp.]